MRDDGEQIVSGANRLLEVLDGVPLRQRRARVRRDGAQKRALLRRDDERLRCPDVDDAQQALGARALAVGRRRPQRQRVHRAQGQVAHGLAPHSGLRVGREERDARVVGGLHAGERRDGRQREVVGHLVVEAERRARRQVVPFTQPNDAEHAPCDVERELEHPPRELIGGARCSERIEQATEQLRLVWGRRRASLPSGLRRRFAEGAGHARTLRSSEKSALGNPARTGPLPVGNLALITGG